MHGSQKESTTSINFNARTINQAIFMNMIDEKVEEIESMIATSYFDLVHLISNNIIFQDYYLTDGNKSK